MESDLEATLPNGDSSEYEKSSECEEPGEDEANVRRTLLEHINQIQAIGSFATGNVINNCPIPGICVDGEPIAIPLSKKAAQDLASKSDKAPFGHHGETKVDEAVRKTLQISAERISFLNPAWDVFVNKLVQDVVHELGVPAHNNVRAELYKHLLYEEGAKFKPHKDTEKDKGMFGTLVICLPSEHEGGEVYLEHGKDSLKLSTATTSAYNYYYLAWYTDVTHEIKPVRTGYRWVLTYNLITDYKSSLPSASVLDSQIQSLVGALSSWEKIQYPPDFLIYPLDYQYTSRNLRLSSLKGIDYQRARYLADSCEQHGKFYLFLAQLDKVKRWPIDAHGAPDVTSWRRLHHVCSLEGFKLSPLEVVINKTSLLSHISYDRRPDYHAGGGYLGNQHEDIEETYSDMVFVIVRADSLHSPLCKPRSQDIKKLMSHLRAGINDNNKTMLQKILVHLCRTILDQGFAVKAANDLYLGYVAVTAVFLGDRPLFEEAREKTLKGWHYNSWYTLGELIHLQNPPTNLDNIFKALLKYGTFDDTYKGLTYFYNGFCEKNIGRRDLAKVEYWKQWYSDTQIKTLNMCNTSRGGEDAAIIKKIILDLKIQDKYTLEQRKKIYKAVTDFVRRFKEAKKFVNALNVELLLELSDPENARQEFLRDLFGIISEFAISTFDFDFYYAYHYENTSRLIRDFYEQALAHKKNSASNLLQQLSKKASNAKKSTVLVVLWPLIEDLLPSVDTGSPEVQTCFQSLVEAYITKAVGEEPSEPEDWARPTEVYQCYPECQACPELNLFLKDPKAKCKTLALAAKLEHVKRNFNYLQTGYRRGDEVCFTKTLKGWENGHRSWKKNVKAVQRKLQELPKDALKQVLGSKYDTLMALDLIRIGRSTAQAPDKAQPPSRPKRKKGEDTNTGTGRTLKRARGGGEKIEG